MVQTYWTMWGHGLSCQQDAETTIGSAAVSRLGLLGCIFLLAMTSWLTPLWAAQVNLAWDATTTYTDGTLVTVPVDYHLSLQDNMGGLQRVDVGNQTTYPLTGLTEGLIYTITVTATDITGLESLPSDAIMVTVPVTQPETALTPVGTAVSIVVLDTDTDPTSPPLTITAVTQGAHGEVTITGTSVTYKPEPSFIGTDSFTYTVTYEQGTPTTTTVTVTVLPGWPPPLTDTGPTTPPGGTSGPNPGLPGSPPPLAGAGPAAPPGGTAGTIDQPASSGQPADYSVWVGYADLTDAVPANFPIPWEGSPGVIFKGCPDCPILDTGAVRIVNNIGRTLTINAVIVRLDTCTVNLWPSDISLPFGGEFIVTQTANGGNGGCTAAGQLDTSNVSSRGADSTEVCTPSHVVPQIAVTVQGVTTTFADTGQIFNTGGIDAETCRNGTNLSTQWTSIGSAPCPHAVLTVTPSTQSQEVGTTATVGATFTNSCGTPLAGVNVDFTGFAGPNVGTVHMDTTDRSGSASFSYTSASSGTDTLRASVTNPAGTLTSSDVSVTWTNATSAPATSAARGGGGVGSGGGGGGGGGGGCSLQPWEAGSPAFYLAALGNLALPVVVLLILRLWSWRQQR